ncbi:MAG: hypothetical protein LUE29_02970 [Lachnospiraceae bacterium]|nr:hypothetical protein [Lachnospiraceae bacterium]
MLVYYLTGLLFRRWGKGVAAGNVILCLASLYFFSVQENAYLPVLLIMIAVDYGVGWLIFSVKRHPALRRVFFQAAIFLHVLTLVLFGGSALADSFANLIGGELLIARTPGMLYTETSGLLFGGIFGVLFYTLHGISYLTDIYRKKAEPQKNPVNVAVYLSMFPLMVVGPVQIYHRVERQLRERPIHIRAVSHGILRTVCGAGKLWLFAVPFRELFRTILSMGLSELSVFGAIFLWFVYFLAVYFLFTGCSDMANGMCLMLGFDFGDNYDAPCAALSVTEYWKRWNVSLTMWFREYVYIPLGGNHCDRSVQAWNLFLTWICIGLWHGFSVNTLVFGVFFGALTVAELYLGSSPGLFELRDFRGLNHRERKEKVAGNTVYQSSRAVAGQFTFRPEIFKLNGDQPKEKPGKERTRGAGTKKASAAPKTPRRFYMIFCVAFAWLLLMFETPEELVAFFRALVGANGSGLGDSATVYYIYSNLILIFAALICMSPVPQRILELLVGERKRYLAALATGIAVLIVCAAGLFVSPEIFEENAVTNRFFCKITTYISYLTNQNEDKDIYFGDDGYLFASHKSWLVDETVQEENLEAIAEAIETMQGNRLTAQTAAEEADEGEETVSAAEETDGGEETASAAEEETDGETETVSATEISFSCVLVPGASYILSDEMPLYAPEWDESQTSQAARRILGSNYISCIGTLKRNAGEELYYHSEEGVTSIGAYYVYALWASEIGLEPTPYTDRSMKTVYEAFYGSLARTLRFYPEADSILRYRSFRYTPVTVEYSDGVVRYSLYEEKYLGTKQELNYYLNGTQDIVRVTTNRTEAEDLLVITDDSGRRYVQYFVEHFHTITVVNVAEYEGSITELAEETGAAEVLFLFDMSSVYEDDTIARKLR